MTNVLASLLPRLCSWMPIAGQLTHMWLNEAVTSGAPAADASAAPASSAAPAAARGLPPHTPQASMKHVYTATKGNRTLAESRACLASPHAPAALLCFSLRCPLRILVPNRVWNRPTPMSWRLYRRRQMAAARRGKSGGVRSVCDEPKSDCARAASPPRCVATLSRHKV